MAGLPEVIGLLYRAGWTGLFLSAGLRSETDREPLPRLPRERWSRAWPGQRQDNGRYAGRGALLIGPGGRAARMLAATPELARYSFATAVILGDAGRVRTELGRDPGLCTRVYVWTRAKGATGRSAY